MQVAPTPLPATGTDPGSAAGAGAIAVPAAGGSTATSAPAPPASAGADRADIRALDLPAMLLILETEILDAAAACAPGMGGGAAPPQAALRIVDALLRSLPPEEADEREWLAAAQALQGAVLAGAARATALAAGRADTPPALLAALPETQALIAAALSDDPAAALTALPGWLALAPRLQRFRRRLRRRLLDPDTGAPSDPGADSRESV